MAAHPKPVTGDNSNTIPRRYWTLPEFSWLSDITRKVTEFLVGPLPEPNDLTIRCPQGRVGSSPSSGTVFCDFSSSIVLTRNSQAHAKPTPGPRTSALGVGSKGIEWDRNGLPPGASLPYRMPRMDSPASIAVDPNRSEPG
jgi:hypothetical protein